MNQIDNPLIEMQGKENTKNNDFSVYPVETTE